MVLLAGGARRASRTGAVLRLAGLSLIALAVSPLLGRGLRRAGARRRHLIATSSVEIERPVSDVFAFFKDFESFPRVVGALHSVIDYGDGRSHWEMYSPSGRLVSWNVVVTKYLPSSVIGWESVPGSAIHMKGVVRFTSVSQTRTRVDLEIAYRPARTGLSDAVHAMFARRPSTAVAQALDHARFYLESLPDAAENESDPVSPVAMNQSQG